MCKQQAAIELFSKNLKSRLVYTSTLISMYLTLKQKRKFVFIDNRFFFFLFSFIIFFFGGGGGALNRGEGRLFEGGAYLI